MKLKKPLELTIYPKQLNGSGIYSIARLENEKLVAVTYHYETEKWEMLPKKFLKSIISIDTLRVAEEVLHLNGVGWIIGKKF